KAISPQPGDRFNTGREMKIAIDEWLASSGPAVTPPHVAMVVRERIGPILEKRREKIRAASHVHQAGSGSGAVISLPGGTPSKPHAVEPSASGVVPKAGDYSGITGPAMPAIAPLPAPTTLPLIPIAGGTPSGVSGGLPIASAAYPAPSQAEVETVPMQPVATQTNPEGTYVINEAPPPSIAKYLLAMAIGIGVALVVGFAAIAVIHTLRRLVGGEAPPPPVPSALVKVAPPIQPELPAMVTPPAPPASIEPPKDVKPPEPKVEAKADPPKEQPKPDARPTPRPHNGPTRLP
ncbi:MAG: hypothetical protein ABIP39_03945, partial [Polyangiaceae bacterium]